MSDESTIPKKIIAIDVLTYVSNWIKLHGWQSMIFVFVLTTVLLYYVVPKIVSTAFMLDDRYAKVVQLNSAIDTLNKRLDTLYLSTTDFAEVYTRDKHKNAPTRTIIASSVPDASMLSDEQKDAILKSMPADVRIIAITNNKR